MEPRHWYALAGMFLIGLALALAVVIFRQGTDNTVIVGLILGFTSTSIVTMGGFLKTYTAVNSRMDEFKAATLLQFRTEAAGAAALAFAEGRKEGVASANVRTDVLAAKKDDASVTVKVSEMKVTAVEAKAMTNQQTKDTPK